MSNMLGLIELLLVLSVGGGFAINELRSLRRDRARPDTLNPPPLTKTPPD